MDKETIAVENQTGKMAGIRASLARASEGALSASEATILKGQLASLEAAIARVNARVGREVAAFSTYSLMAKDMPSAVAV